MSAEVVVSVVAVLVSVLSLYQSWKGGTEQAVLQGKQLQLSEDNVKLQDRISRNEAIAESGRFFSIIWDKFIKVNDVDPDKPVEMDLKYALNVLELIALSWQAGIVDKQMVFISLCSPYDSLCQQISQIKPGVLPTMYGSGYDILARAPVIQAVREEMIAMRNERGSIQRKP